MQIESMCSQKTEQTTGITTSAHFLDLELTLHNNNLTITNVQKEDQVTFQPVQYIQEASNRPLSACYKVLIGLCKNLIYHNTTPQGLQKNLRRLLRKFCKHGFKRWKCIATLDRWVTKQQFAGAAFDVHSFWQKKKHTLRS